MMRRIMLHRLFESDVPPVNPHVLWCEKDENNDIKVIRKFKNGEWTPWLVNVDFMKPEEEVAEPENTEE